MNIAQLFIRRSKDIVDDTLDGKKVKDLLIGEIGWIIPWSVDISSLDVNTESFVCLEKLGTADVCIQRLSHEWYSIDMSESDKCITMKNDPSHFGFGKIIK